MCSAPSGEPRETGDEIQNHRSNDDNDNGNNNNNNKVTIVVVIALPLPTKNTTNKNTSGERERETEAAKRGACWTRPLRSGLCMIAWWRAGGVDTYCIILYYSISYYIIL